MESKKPLFSVITVTYNAGKNLETTLQSVCEQHDARIEYIVVDGGSTDGTLKIIERYSSFIARWISEPDQGLYDAMNKGIKLATGDYVWFLNAGDTIRNTEVVRQMSEIAEREDFPDILYGETDLVDVQGNFIAERRLKAPERLNWKSFRMGMLVCHQAFIVKRERAPLYDLTYRLSGDFDWCIRCMKTAGRIVNTHLRLVNYLYEGLTTRNRKASLKERYRIMVKYYGWLPVTSLHIWFAIRFYWAKWFRGVV